MAIPRLVWSALLAASMSSCYFVRGHRSHCSYRLGVQGSFFCGQACFKADCEPPPRVRSPISLFTNVHICRGMANHSTFTYSTHLSDYQKTHKVIHDLATPRQPLLDDP